MLNPANPFIVKSGKSEKMTTVENARTYPTHAILKGRGRVRILHYSGNGYFDVLTNRDARVHTHRNNLIFTKK